MKTKIVLGLFVVMFSTGALSSRCFAQGENKTEVVERKIVAVPIPTGSVQPTAGFSVSYSVESRLGLGDGPVKVVANESRVEDGMGITRVLIENLSGKEVVAVRLRWYLFQDETSKSYGKDGETKEIKVDHLMPGAKKVIASGLPGFDEMFKSLSKDGLISGGHYLEVVISEVVFADKSKWQLPKKSAAAQ